MRVSVFSAVRGGDKPCLPSFLSTVGVKPGPGLWLLKSQDTELSSALPGPVPERSVAPPLPFFAWSSQLSFRPSVRPCSGVCTHPHAPAGPCWLPRPDEVALLTFPGELVPALAPTDGERGQAGLHTLCLVSFD